MIQQRLGETYEEFEKRKRRVKLQSVPFGDMFAYAGGGSQVLALILYTTKLGNFVYKTDGSGNAILDNQGSGSPSYNGLLNTGRAVELGATNNLPIPIHHTLGSDLTQTATSVGAGWVDNTDDTYTGTLASTDIVGLSSITSGVVQVEITLSGVTAGDVNGYNADGTYIFEETLSGTALALTGTGFTGTVSLV